jgi:hypothetical protein
MFKLLLEIFDIFDKKSPIQLLLFHFLENVNGNFLKAGVVAHYRLLLL